MCGIADFWRADLALDANGAWQTKGTQAVHPRITIQTMILFQRLLPQPIKCGAQPISVCSRPFKPGDAP
jgi:hypothetical protein